MMIVALVLGIVYGYFRKTAVDNDGGGVSREYLVANTLFYGFLFVSILFFWNWFNLHSPAFTAIGDETVSLVWIIIDALLPLVTGAMGIHVAARKSCGIADKSRAELPAKKTGPYSHVPGWSAPLQCRCRPAAASTRPVERHVLMTTVATP